VKALWLTWRKVKWMLWALMAPELLLAFALDKLYSARRSVREMKDLAESDSREWTLTHAFFANMGGFVIEFPDDATGVAPAAISQDVTEFCEEQTRRFRRMGSVVWRPHRLHCETATKVGFVTDDYDNINLLRLCGNVWVLNARQIFLARRSGIISQLPHPLEDDLKDKSKSDGLVKLLAVIQLLWLVLQLVGRAVQGRPSSQLEIMALSYAVCAAITYIVLWFQLKDVSQPVVLQSARSPSQMEIEEIRSEGPLPVFRSDARYIIGNHTVMNADHIFLNGALSGALVFGLIHLAAWNFDFPSYAERLLWRVCSLILGCVSAPYYGMVILASKMNTDLVNILVAPVLALTLLSRLVLLVETFRSLYFMEPAAYTTISWGVNILHLG
jgi:hypothetical protein